MLLPQAPLICLDLLAYACWSLNLIGSGNNQVYVMSRLAGDTPNRRYKGELELRLGEEQFGEEEDRRDGFSLILFANPLVHTTEYIYSYTGPDPAQHLTHTRPTSDYSISSRLCLR
jgi:hypothetical protein